MGALDVVLVPLPPLDSVQDRRVGMGIAWTQQPSLRSICKGPLHVGSLLLRLQWLHNRISLYDVTVYRAWQLQMLLTRPTDCAVMRQAVETR